MAPGAACVIYQDVNAAQTRQKRRDHVVYLFGISDIALHCQATASHCLYIRDELLQVAFSASGDTDIRACFGECQSNTTSDAAACSCDDCFFSFKGQMSILRHGCAPFLSYLKMPVKCRWRFTGVVEWCR